MSHPYALGVVGTGHIALIIVRRLMDSGYLTGDRIIVSPSRKLAAHPLVSAREDARVIVAKDNAEVVSNSKIILLSVTPQKFAEAGESIREAACGDHLFISVMAGVSTEHIARVLGGRQTASQGRLNDEAEGRTDYQGRPNDEAKDRVGGSVRLNDEAADIRVIRVMPNLPFKLGRGVTGLFRGRHASIEDAEEAKHLFAAGGVVVTLDDEALMDAVTAVAGSGPAYFYYFVEMMMAGGVAAGLKREDAQVLAAHACVGAGAMLLEERAAPAELRAAVTSPGGTTQAAMNKLTEAHVAELVTEAVLAAYRRSQELGRLHVTTNNDGGKA